MCLHVIAKEFKILFDSSTSTLPPFFLLLSSLPFFPLFGWVWRVFNNWIVCQISWTFLVFSGFVYGLMSFMCYLFILKSCQSLAPVNKCHNFRTTFSLWFLVLGVRREKLEQLPNSVQPTTECLIGPANRIVLPHWTGIKPCFVQPFNKLILFFVSFKAGQR